MIEKILFADLELPGESIRIAFAFIGLLITSYYDLYNNKNIPEKLLFIFLGISFLINLYFYDSDITSFAIILAVIVGLFGYVFNRFGQLGSADVIVLSAISLLLPIHPSISNLTPNYPFIFSLLVYSGVLFALYTIVNFGSKIIKKKNAKPNLTALIIFIPYLLFIYMYLQLPLFPPNYLIIVSLVVFSSLFFLAYKEDINQMLVKKLPLGKVEEEDVIALEYMDKKLVNKYKIGRVISEKEIKRLKKLGIKELWIFANLPPFLPFLLIGFILSVLYSNLLLS